MSAIALVLLDLGYQVSGSDLHASDLTAKLSHRGGVIHLGHQAANLNGETAIVVSTAIRPDNPEYAAALERKLPIYHRSDLLAALMRTREGIAIAGAHGKTTTTSMIALLLEKGGLDPTILIGGELDEIGGNAKLGSGKFLVAEADESDGSFLKLAPRIAVVTNIENDHLDYYGTMDNVRAAFDEFMGKVHDSNGLTVACADSPIVRELCAVAGRSCISYAIEQDAHFQAASIASRGMITEFEVLYKGKKQGNLQLSIPGRHNIANSLAALAVGQEVGMSFERVAEIMPIFRGAKRRFQIKGNVGGIRVVDDYGHHPTEIFTTLRAARDATEGRVICIFQPHRYSRTKLLAEEFGKAFDFADVVILTDIYSAGELPIEGVSGDTIRREVERHSGKSPYYTPELNQIVPLALSIARAGDMVLTMGAGNIYRVGEELVLALTKESENGKMS